MIKDNFSVKKEKKMTLARKPLVVGGILTAILGGTILAINRAFASKNHKNQIKGMKKNSQPPTTPPQPLPSESISVVVSETIFPNTFVYSNVEDLNLPYAEDFRFEDGAGGELKLSDFFDKPAVLYFWASNSSDCREEMPYLAEMFTKYGNIVNFVPINLTGGLGDTKQSAAEFEATFGSGSGKLPPIYFDVNGEGRRAYDILAVPETIFLTKGGKIRYKWHGAISKKSLEKQITHIL